MTDDEKSDERATITPGDETAIALALMGASRERADVYLAEQTKVAEAQAEFLRLQAEDFRHEEPLRQRSLQVRHASDLIKLAFELSLALLVLVIAAAIGSAFWNAAHDNGLVIEAFSVPPDLSNRGLTGDVMASRLLDKLSVLQAQTVSNRAPSSFTNDWGNDIKVEIPDTGVSIGQIYFYLRQWLGHETHIRGDVYRDAAGRIAISARVDTAPTPTFSGNEADLDKLLQQTAEAVYQKTQPYRYAVYLSNHGRSNDAEAAYHELIAHGSPQDSSWAYVGLSTVYQVKGDHAQSEAALWNSLTMRPDFVMAYVDLGSEEGQYQHDEASLVIGRKIVALLNQGPVSDIDADDLAYIRLQNDESLANSVGDFQEQLAIDRKAEAESDFAGQIESIRENDLQAFAFLHDAAGEEVAIAALPKSADANILLNRNANMVSVDYMFERWKSLWPLEKIIDGELAQFGHGGDSFRERVMEPLIAGAMAQNGNFAGANAKIARSAIDCDLCVRMRGRIAAAEHRWAAADYWFAMVSARAPDIPFADTDWGQTLLARGDTGRAIEKFASAHTKGPHFADPLEMWGEALMRQNRSDLALAKFAEAEKYAPNWGRLHLKWGEALLYAGDGENAKKQFAIASNLALFPKEKFELERVAAAHR